MRDADFLVEALSKHGSMMSILGSRQASLRIAKSLWQRGDVRGALNSVLQSAGENSRVAEVLLAASCLSTDGTGIRSLQGV